MVKRLIDLQRALVGLSTTYPWVVVGMTLLLTAAFGLQFPKITIDTDPKHMLPVTSPVRQYNDQVEKEFALHADVIALGIVNERGIINRKTLSRIAELTRQIQKMPGVISRDVVSFSTIDNVTTQGEALSVRPVLDRIPESEGDLEGFRKALLTNPLFINRIVSPDGTATAIYAPIEPTANGKEIADRIRSLLPKEPDGDQFYLAGDPVARDTFGAEMFRQMALFSPVAGLAMCIALWLMFRSIPLIVANMAVAMVSIIWAMGLFIGLGYPIHIMSSMSPVFLMAIATDSVHIFNEFAFRSGELRDKRRAVLDTMATVGGPVFYSDVTTAVGFASLATATIVPVKIFGLLVGFGTLVILLMSFTLVPAILMLLREDHIPKVTRGPDRGDPSRRSLFQGRYKAIVCDKDEYLLALIRYIHRNPLRAKLVRRTEQYRYTADRNYRQGVVDGVVEPGAVLAVLGGRAGYRKLMRQGEQEGHRGDYYEVEDQRFLGAKGFGEKLKNKYEEQQPSKPRQAFSVAYRNLARGVGVEPEVLGGADRGWEVSKARAMVGYVLMRRLGYPLTEVAKSLGRDVATVSSLISRFAERVNEEAELRKKAERLAKID